MIDVLAVSEEILRRTGMEHRHVSVIELNRSAGAHAALTLMVFVDQRPRPSIIVKATPSPQRALALSAEFDNLTLLSRHGSPSLQSTVPRPLCFFRADGYAVLAESALGGQRMKDLPPGSYFSSPRFAGDCAAIADWLGELHRCFASSAVPPLPSVQEPPGPGGGADAAAAVGRYRERFRLSPALDALLEQSRAHLDGLGARCPRSPWHGDFCSANILVEGEGAVRVIDWEIPLVRTWPLLDLLYCFSSFWCTRYRRGRAALVANQRRLFFERHALTQPLQRATARYLRALGLGPEDIMPLSVIAWVMYANRKDENLDADPALRGGADVEHWPLVIIDERRCVNLELLAENRHRYALVSAGSP